MLAVVTKEKDKAMKQERLKVLSFAMRDETMRELVKQFEDMGADVEHQGRKGDVEGEGYIVRVPKGPNKGMEIMRGLISSQKTWLVSVLPGLVEARGSECHE